ncbi:MAG: S8 family serine peptidase [Pseudomonadota bacterium]
MRLALLAAVAAAILPAAAVAGEVDARLQAVLDRAAPEQTVAVIVLHRNARTPIERAPGLARRKALMKGVRERAERDLPELETKIRSRGGRTIRRLWTIDGLAVRLPASAVRELVDDPSVGEIKLDATVNEPQATYESGAATAEWNVAMIRAPELWARNVRGRGVTVAVLDSGVDHRHPELAAKWRGGTNSWFDPYGRHEQPFDNSGHGTHVAGIAVGGRDGWPALGVAPDAKWMAAKIFDDGGLGSLSAIHLSFQWLLDPDGAPDTDDTPQVVVTSWHLGGGTGSCWSEFAADIALLREAGIAVVSSAGNTGPFPNTSVSPANNPGAFPVGSVDAAGGLADESGRGPSACGGGVYPMLAAPGVSVRVADLTYGGAFLDSYAVVSGTSFAAPHLAGAIALLAGARGGRAVEELEAALTTTAVDAGAQGPDNESGHGIVDASAALMSLGEGEPLVDGDGDGYAVEADCRDDDHAVHPGAIEVRDDGIDQNCNGHDLTIQVTSVRYNSRRDYLRVDATSALGKSAGLYVEGYGAMTWNRRSSLWTLSARGVPSSPTSLTIRGVEGEVQWRAGGS